MSARREELLSESIRTRCLPCLSVPYASHGPDLSDAHELDLQAAASAFGFSVPPKVDSRPRRGGTRVKKHTKGGAQSGHKFSAENPYGKRAATDQLRVTH